MFSITSVPTAVGARVALDKRRVANKSAATARRGKQNNFRSRSMTATRWMSTRRVDDVRRDGARAQRWSAGVRGGVARAE
jgi:hypothetical protein